MHYKSDQLIKATRHAIWSEYFIVSKRFKYCNVMYRDAIYAK